MFRSTAFKVSLIILLALAVGYYDLPAEKQTVPGTPESIKQAKYTLGLDLQGGSQLDYKIDLRKVPEADREDIVEGVREVITRRVNALGVSEPNIYLSSVGNEKHLIVELAGITDLEEAKNTVGKTIQLEFKEPSQAEDPELKSRMEKLAQAALKKIQRKQSSFTEVGNEDQLGFPGRVRFVEGDYQFESEINNDEIFTAIQKSKNGDVVNKLFEGSFGILQRRNGFTGDSGFSLIEFMGKRNAAELPEPERAVQASHILIQYADAKRAADSVKRTKEEAKLKAGELLQQLRASANFETLAKENSDEPGAKESAGKLPQGVSAKSGYVKKFVEAAQKLSSVGEYSDVTETEFGFHLIRADNFEQYKFNRIFYSALPDEWQDTGLTGEQFKRADVIFGELGDPQVQITFNDEGGKLFEEITKRNVDKPVAIFVGGTLISAPIVQGPISGGVATITSGNFTVQSAKELARDLNTGAIPAPVVYSGQLTIGATLGAEALNTSLKAGIVGLIILSIFMIVYYRLPGLISVIALFIYSLILLFFIKSNLPTGLAVTIAIAIFATIVLAILRSKDGGWEKFLSFVLACFVLFFVAFILTNPVVLTLAGVAGVILSIGMAIDANILIFERMKEELHAGRPLSSAIEVGFERAWSSIRDSNFSSLITCAILFYFGTSIIKGFAFNLAAGILISMFSAITITRTLLSAFVKTRLRENLALWKVGFTPVDERRVYHIVENRKVWYGVSGTLVALLLISLAVFGLKLGIDFTGGSLLDVSFSKPPASVEEVRTALVSVEEKNAPAPESPGTTTIVSASAPLELGSARIITSPDDPSRFVLNLPHLTNEQHDAILQTLQKNFGEVTENRFTTIGPVVGNTLRQRAFFAVVIALAAIILYVAFAFRKVPREVNPWKFGICAIIALLHDVMIPIGIFSILQFEIDALFITAILTVLGFSVHDTIVVFDRIREQLKTKSRDESLTLIANKSLTQTIGRSINTSLTTLITLVALLLLGSPSIFQFILVLVIGIFVGTYSSIFIATPLLVQWQQGAKRSA